MFFVATSGGEDATPNCSPKSLKNSFAVLGPRRVAYLDSYGSGIETIAHAEKRGSYICLMMCGFQGAPFILRFHGTPRIVLRERDSDFHQLKHSFEIAGPASADHFRAIVVVSDSDLCCLVRHHPVSVAFAGS